ncbi:MAG: hypothetical protein J6J71_04840 [Prevotella sp.]|nr:hypothetical protein [Prevotella sp.]
MTRKFCDRCNKIHENINETLTEIRFSMYANIFTKGDRKMCKDKQNIKTTDWLTRGMTEEELARKKEKAIKEAEAELREKRIYADEVVEEMASAIREITTKCGKCEYYKDGSCLKPIDMGCGDNEDILISCDAIYEKGFRNQREIAKRIFGEIESIFSTDGFHLFCNIEGYNTIKKQYTENGE